MELLTRYRQLIRRILTEHTRVPYFYGNIKSVTVFDAESNHLALHQGSNQWPATI